MKRLTAIAVLTFAAAATAGHFLRTSETSIQHPTETPPTETPPTETPSTETPSTGALPSIETFQDLTETLDQTTDPQALAKLFENVDDDFRRRRLVVLRWASIDPTSALEFLAARPTDPYGSWYTRALFETWGAADAATAFANITALPEPREHHDAARAALDGAASVDPDRAFALFFAAKRDLPPHDGHRPSGWIHENPETTLTNLQKYGPDTEWTKDVRAGLLETWAKADPATSLQWVKANLDHLAPWEVLEFTLPLASSDTAAAAEFFASLPDRYREPEAAGAIASKLLEHDPAAALIWIDDNMKGLPKHEAVHTMLDALAKRDPTTAAGYVAELPTSDREAGTIVHTMMEAWARTDPAAALAWAHGDAPEHLRAQADRALGAAWAKHDQAAVVAYLQELPADAVSDRFLDGIVQDGFGWDDDPDRKLAFTNQLPDHHAARIAPGIAAEWSYMKPAQAAATAVAFTSPAAREAAAAAVVPGAIANERDQFASWLADNPTHAPTFLEALQDPKLHADQVQETLDLYRAATAE